eukprot:scaffold66031_cov19-Tisochrysis_lutea.AAC.2
MNSRSSSSSRTYKKTKSRDVSLLLPVTIQAERAEHEAKKRAQKEAERKRIADAMEQNYINWHTKEEQVCLCVLSSLANRRKCTSRGGSEGDRHTAGARCGGRGGAQGRSPRSTAAEESAASAGSSGLQQAPAPAEGGSRNVGFA